MSTQHETPFGDDVMSTAKAAEFLGYSVNAFHARSIDWGLEPERIGGRNYYWKADLEKIKAGRVKQQYGMGGRWVVPTDWKTAS